MQIVCQNVKHVKFRQRMSIPLTPMPAMLSQKLLILKVAKFSNENIVTKYENIHINIKDTHQTYHVTWNT